MPNLNERALSDVLMISNTPTFLFERFRRDASVQAIAGAYSASDLAARAFRLSSGRDREYLDRVRSYAHLVALSFKPLSEIREALQLHRLPTIPWAPELAQLAISSAPSETYKVIQAMAPPRQLVEIPNATSSSTFAIVAKQRPPEIVVGTAITLPNLRKEINLA